MSLEQDLGEYRPVLISFEINAEANKYLSEASKRSGRTKRQEAKLRLHDHLDRYISISELKKAEKRLFKGDINEQ